MVYKSPARRHVTSIEKERKNTTRPLLLSFFLLLCFLLPPYYSVSVRSPVSIEEVEAAPDANGGGEEANRPRVEGDGEGVVQSNESSAKVDEPLLLLRHL